MVVIQNRVFSQRLHGVNLLVSDPLDKEHFTETSSSDDTLDSKVLELNGFLFFLSLEHSVSSASSNVCVHHVDLAHVHAVVRRVAGSGWATRHASTLNINSISGYVDVFLLKSILLLRVDFKSVHDVFLRGVVLFKLIWHTVEWQILVVFVVINILDGVKDLRSELTLVDVIVLRGDMHDKLDASVFGTFGDGFDLLYIDFSLDLVLLDVVQ